MVLQYLIFFGLAAYARSERGAYIDNFARSARLTDTAEFVLDTTPLRWSTDSASANLPAVSGNDSEYLVAWSMQRKGIDAIWACRVSRDGVLLDTVPFLACSTRQTPQRCSVAWGDSLFLVVSEYTGADIRCARVTRDGRSLDPGGILIANGAPNHYWPSATFDGRQFLVVWHSDSLSGRIRRIRVAQVSLAGTVEPSGGGILVRPASAQSTVQRPSVVSSRGISLAVWQSDEVGCWAIWGTRVDSLGQAIDSLPFLISDEASAGTLPAAASDGNDFLVVWCRNSDPIGKIVGKRVDRSGTVIERRAFEVGGIPTGSTPPAIAFDGGNYIVAWQGSPNGTDDIYAARVTPGGIVLDPQGRPIATQQVEQSPTLASGGGNCLAVWLGFLRNPYVTSPYAVRVSPDCGVMDSAIALDARRSVPIYAEQSVPDVAFNGHEYLVTWQDQRNSSTAPDIYGIRVSSTGVVLDSCAFPISLVTNLQVSPKAAAGDSDFFVVWQDHRGPGWDIFAARISGGGEVLDSAGLLVATINGFLSTPATAFDGTNYLVVWINGSRASSDGPVKGILIDQDGNKLDSVGFVISEAVSQLPALAFGDSTYLTAWQDFRISQYLPKIRCRRVARDGGIPDTASFLVGSNYESTQPSVAYGDGEWCTAWYEYAARGLYAARVSSAGVPLDSTKITLRPAGPGSAGRPSTTFDGSNFVTVWHDTRGGTRLDVWCARLRPDGSLLDSFLFAQGTYGRTNPAIAHGPDGQALVVYTCTTSVVNGHVCGQVRVCGRFHQDTASTSSVPRSRYSAITPSSGVAGSRIPGTSLRVGVSFCSRHSGVSFKLAGTGPNLHLEVRDVQGRRVRRFDKVQDGTLTWNLTDDRGTVVAPGIFFVSLLGGGFEMTRRITLAE